MTGGRAAGMTGGGAAGSTSDGAAGETDGWTIVLVDAHHDCRTKLGHALVQLARPGCDHADPVSRRSLSLVPDDGPFGMAEEVQEVQQVDGGEREAEDKLRGPTGVLVGQDLDPQQGYEKTVAHL